MPRPMSDTPDPSDPKLPEPSQDNPGRGDAIALGIGCAVFIIMFIAIVLVGMSGR